MRSLIKIFHSVFLGNNWGRQFHDNHLKKSFSGIDPFLENVLHQMLSLELELIGFHVDVKAGGHFGDGFNFVVHGGFAKLDDWGHDELDEASLKGSFIIGLRVVLPFLGFGIKVVVSPKLLHHLVSGNTELGGVSLGESGGGESPSEKS
jgi:hypothetical protein